MDESPIRLRIIAGQWRRRLIQIPALPGVRPTTDRIRETLFNWLAPVLPGARCCDAFAGSGILGLEALSRGAAHCTFVDTQAKAIRAIEQQLIDFSANNRASCVVGAAEQVVLPADSIDVLFLDPPFDSDLLESMLMHCYSNTFLSSDALVYVEYDPARKPTLPADWVWHRDMSTRRVGYGLVKTGSASGAVVE